MNISTGEAKHLLPGRVLTGGVTPVIASANVLLDAYPLR
jgi:hypothetical protein